MALKPNDMEWIELGLERLFEQSFGLDSDHRRYVREYIDVGEYGLALDNLAYIFIRLAAKPLPTEIRELFEKLALKMGISDGDEWEGVAKVRKS